MSLGRDDMIAEFEIQGYTAIPHPYDNDWIAMPLHHKVDAQYLADHHGWEWIPMGWKPKEVPPVEEETPSRIKIDLRIVKSETRER